MNSEKPKLLLIDDNVDTLDLLEVYLFREYDLLTAGNGFEGLKMAREERFDLIVTDIMMPVMDGIRLFNELRKQENTQAIPVVAITSFLRKITKKSLLSMGFNAVVAKPVDREKLSAVIARQLSRTTVPVEEKVSDETAG
jgi:CheY-like chemotaxis protein